MSRVGKKPIELPEKIEVNYKERVLVVQGPRGSLSRTIHPAVDLNIGKGNIQVSVIDNSRVNRAFQGLTRSLIQNMVTGVNTGFERVLEINGIGYRAMLNGDRIEFSLGFSHPVQFDLPDGIAASIDRNNVIRLTGIDRELLGQTAASIRRLKPPESYKGKGVRYAGERVRLKAGKTGTK